MTLTLNDAAAWPAPERLDGDTEPVITQAAPAIQIRLTIEVALYVGLALLALVLRLAQLDHLPLNDGEARQALAALRALNDRVPGEALVADSPLSFAGNVITFAFMPQNDLAARLPVALAGVLLTLAPALWRRYINLLPPLIVSLLLAISPVSLLAARNSSPVVWTMLLALVAPWLVLRYVETRRSVWAIAATAAFAAMIFLAEPAGFLTVLALAFGVIFAWLINDDPDADLQPPLRDMVRAWPWTDALAAAGIVVIVVGSAAFWIPSGLTAVGNTIWTGLEGFVRRPAGSPVAFPLWIGLRYETGLWLFGLAAAYRAVREGGFFERALVGWALAGTVWLLGYAGATAAHALWLTVPVSILVGLMVTHWLTERASAIWRVPSWGILAHAVVTAALWIVAALMVMMIGKRLLYDIPYAVNDFGALFDKLKAGIYSASTNFDAGEVQQIEVQPGQFVYAYVLRFIQSRALIVVLLPMLNIVLFFLVGSLWGARVAWRGLALGTLIPLLVFSLGLGGRAALGATGDPRDFWYINPVTSDVRDMRATLREMSLRDSGDPHLVAVTALVPQDGALAWALRDYPHTTFVEGVGAEVSTPIVIMPVTFPQPAMGADYIGKTLVIRQGWEAQSITWRDAIMWFYRSDSLVKPVAQDRVMFWVRKDIYGVEHVPEN